MQQDLSFDAEKGSGEESSLFDDELHIVERGEES
jgi:hypothetical protein